VEDDSFLSKIYVEKLSQEPNFKISSFESGKKALASISKDKPDLVLLDILLPDLNGVQILKKMREQEDLKQTPVLMLTNLNERSYVDEALSLGAKGYLIKAHFTPSEVIAKIKQVLRNNK